MKCLLILVGLSALFFTSCATRDTASTILISVKDQHMLLTKHGEPVKSYPISTSKFGLGSREGSKRTPLGNMEVAKMIGKGSPAGTVYKSRKKTGEILQPDAPGRDPIVTRILWLKGLDSHNKNTYDRYIYIHGTPEERNIGRTASYGCIRMRSNDIIDLYNRVGPGAQVKVFRASLMDTEPGRKYAATHRKEIIKSLVKN